MKKISYTLYTLTALMLLGVSVILSSCKGDEPSAKEKTQKQLTAGSWTMNAVTVDGVNKNDLFTGFTLEFAVPNSYTTSNGAPVWPASGTWSFTDDKATTITRDDGIVVTISSISNTNLTLTMTWDKTTLGGGRSASISGSHVFEFTR